MASVINRTTLEYKKSVNTPDYPTGTWIINPDLSALGSVNKKYWKIVADDVLEMTQAEKDVVDQAASDEEERAGLLLEKGTPASATALGHEGKVCIDDNYFYIWTAKDVCKRAALTSF